MAIGTEYLSVIESLRSRMSRIFPDACDVGVRETPRVKAELKHAIAELANLEGLRVTKGTNWTKVETALGFEVEDGLTNGVLVEVTRTVSRGVGAWYFIEVRPDSWNSGGKSRFLTKRELKTASPSARRLTPDVARRWM
jgi:hypothetical protein